MRSKTYFFRIITLSNTDTDIFTAVSVCMNVLTEDPPDMTTETSGEKTADMPFYVNKSKRQDNLQRPKFVVDWFNTTASY
jgi:hypothetical protein